MALIVQKYGGSSLESADRIRAVAERIVATKKQGNDVVVVCSAMGDTTDELLDLAAQVNPVPPQREMDMLLTAGERISNALVAMAVESLGAHAQSFTGSQAGVLTTERHGNARIIDITPGRIREALDAGHIVIVAGFQGVSQTTKEITTLGRGASDTTAVALAAALPDGVALPAATLAWIASQQGVTSVISAGVESRAWREEVTLRAEFEAGALHMLGDEDSRITDRFRGSGRIRGFEANGYGPRDLNAPNEDALGGNFFWAVRAEAQFPLGLPEEYGINGGLFADAGSVWGLDETTGHDGVEVDDSMQVRAAVGVSLFWTTPVGPLRFNLAKAVQKEDYDEEQAFDLTLSTRF